MLRLLGWIASAKDGHDEDVELVNELLESYIEQPNCLILLTVACECELIWALSYIFFL